jgi:MFS family permease
VRVPTDGALVPRAVTTALATFRESLTLLGTRRFGTFWIASLLSSIGTWAQQVAEPWLLLSVGASSFLIGLDAFAMNAPVWLLTLIGGVLADRADRRRVITLMQSIQMLCPLIIVVLLLTTGTVRPALIVALSLVVGITDALSMPSFQSIVPTIVARAQIGRGLALNATQFNLSRILGPAIAGVLMASVGVVACFALSAASYLPFIAIALWILPRGIRAPRTAEAHDGQGLLGGLKVVLAEPTLRSALLTVLATSLLCGPLLTFIPVLIRTDFNGTAGHFSTAVGAFGVGGLLGALVMLGIPPGLDRRRVSAGLALGYGLVLVLIALQRAFWALPALMLLAGAAMTVSNTAANALLQSTAPSNLLGRASSLFMLALRGGLALGSLLTGLAVEGLGIRHALLLNGILAVLTQLLIGGTWLRGARARPT